MFQHHNVNRNKNKKINDKKVKDTVSLLTQFGDKHTYSVGYQARKEIHQCSPYSIALSKLVVYTKDLGPTRIDFNLGTPRSEIPSHYPMVSHSPSDLSDLNTNSCMKLLSNSTTNTLLTRFGVVHTSLQLNKSPQHVSQSIQERLTNIRTKLESNDTRVEHTKTQNPKNLNFLVRRFEWFIRS